MRCAASFALVLLLACACGGGTDQADGPAAPTTAQGAAALPAAGGTGSAQATPAEIESGTVDATANAEQAPGPPPTTIAAPATVLAAGAPRAVLVRIEDRLAALSGTGAEPAWTLHGAVAAADGASAYRADNGQLVRVDTRTGAATERWALPAGNDWRAVVVSPGGDHVVLTDGVIDRDHRPARSRLLVWHRAAPDAPMLIEQAGALEPEALSTNGTLVYLLEHHDSYYRVRVLDTVTDQIFDSFGRDKSPAEDMNGVAVHAALSPDGRVLSTLYRQPADGDHEPFVHVLHLEQGWSYCADLPEGSYTSIASAADGRTVYVGASDNSWIDLDLAALETSTSPIPTFVHRDATPPVPLNPAGTLVTADGVVTADAGGVSWYRDGQLLGRVERPVQRLLALVAN